MSLLSFRAGRARAAAIAFFVLVVSLLALLPTGAGAAQTLADARWFERRLADGVVWRFYLFDDLFGAKQSISYVDADLNNPNVSIEFPYLASSRQKTSAMVPGQFPGAAAGINGTYFDTTGSGGHRTYLRVNNVEVPPGGALFSAWGYNGALALDTMGTASMPLKPAGGWVDDLVHPDIMACGPMLIISNVVQSASFTSIGSHCTGRNPRSAVGLTATNHLILLTADGRTDMAAGMTCEELAQTMAQLNCPNALNLDGGGSTTLWGRGEPYSGVLNFPSDNSAYDHAGERSCSNAIAVLAPAAAPALWDGRLVSKSFAGSMLTGSEQTVMLTYQNIGTQTWTAGSTTLTTARPAGHASPFFKSDAWTSSSTPVLMSPASVAPGQNATFTFALKAPSVPTTTVYNEFFQLDQAGIGRIGPSDSDAWMRVVVEPPATGGASFYVESRSGGQNYAWYTDSGMADSGTNCTATGATGNIGMRYGSTYRSVAGAKSATVAPNFPGAGDYKVYVAWGSGSSRQNPITYTVNHTGGASKFLVDQTAISNTWIQLGTTPFNFNVGYGGTVVMSNADIDVSGSMYTGAFKFEFVPPARVADWSLY